MNTSQENILLQGLGRYFLSEELEKVQSATVGIAGCGGLGSNVALLLARSGIEHMLLIDHDTVEPSNLNRQHFFPRHVGKNKVDAVEELLLELNPHMRIEKHCLRLEQDNIQPMLEQAPLWIEALDQAQSKRLFVESALMAQRFTVSASGIAGCGGAPMSQRTLGKYLVIVGDFSSDIAHMPPLAPRVMQAAAMQADAMLAHILYDSAE